MKRSGKLMIVCTVLGLAVAGLMTAGIGQAGAAVGPANDFEMSVYPSAVAVRAGHTAEVWVNVSQIAGTAETVTLSVVKPATVGASFSPSATVVPTSPVTRFLNLSVGVTTIPGAHTITIRGIAASASHSVTLTLLVKSATGTACYGSNNTQIPIPDEYPAVGSGITISGCGRDASATARVSVLISHTYGGQLLVELWTENAEGYVLHPVHLGQVAHNVQATYTVDLSSEIADGNWRLKVTDTVSGSIGTIINWNITP